MSDKDKSFSVYSLTLVDEEMNRDYCHWSEGLTMYISKGGVTMKLEADEIEQVVKALPRTVGGTY